jgi:UDP-galactopyranose mutase
MKKILILGGGVAGSSAAYFLGQKGFDITLVEKNNEVGGLARTMTYSGHPYEFGPHVWFWPGGPENEVNKVVHDLTNGELFYIERKLLSFIEEDNKAYRYPLHFEDIKKMDNKEQILSEIKTFRDENLKLKDDEMPKIGECSFEDYFQSAVGKTLYNKFMNNYSEKMWNIPGDKLETRMVWADRFLHAYSNVEQGGMKGYDPLKFETHTLGKGIKFQVYPKKGWNAVWDEMVKDAKIKKLNIDKIIDEDNPYISTNEGEEFYFSDYEYVINTLDIDELWGEDQLPYTGRMMIPLVLPELGSAFPNETESVHYSSAEFVTRVTEMKVITQHKSKDTLLLIEVPILPSAENAFPQNTIDFAKKNNLYARKAYPQQSAPAIELYERYVKKGEHIKNLIHCGRHAQFRYWGMPETVNSALQLSKTLNV